MRDSQDNYSINCKDDCGLYLVESSHAKKPLHNFFELEKIALISCCKLKSIIRENFRNFNNCLGQSIDIKLYSFYGIQIHDDSDLHLFLEKEVNNRIIFFCKENSGFNYRCLLNCFKIKQKIGEDVLGKVYIADQRFNLKEYRVKLLKPKTTEVLLNFKEIETLSKLEHPHIIKLVNYGHLEDNQIFIILEHLEGGSLKGKLA